MPGYTSTKRKAHAPVMGKKPKVNAKKKRKKGY